MLNEMFMLLAPSREHSSNSPSTGNIPSSLDEFGSSSSYRASSMLESEARDRYVEDPGTS